LEWKIKNIIAKKPSNFSAIRELAEPQDDLPTSEFIEQINSSGIINDHVVNKGLQLRFNS